MATVLGAIRDHRECERARKLMIHEGLDTRNVGHRGTCAVTVQARVRFVNTVSPF